MDRRNSKRFRVLSAVKLLLALILFVGFLSNIAPLVPVAAGSACTLECCAGKVPHAAGSCMGGACEVPLRTHSKKRVRLQPARQDDADHFCGLSRSVVAKSLAQTRTNHARPRVMAEQTVVSATAFDKACQPDCGACGSGSTNSSRSKNWAAIAGAAPPQGPSALYLSHAGYDRAHVLDALDRQCAPRGPPLSLS